MKSIDFRDIDEGRCYNCLSIAEPRFASLKRLSGIGFRSAEFPSPRLLTREEASAYCGVAPETFDNYRRQGILPEPLSGTKRWDRKLIDEYLDRNSGITKSSDVTPLDAWRAKRHDQD